MPVWAWVLVAAVVVLTVPLLVALAIARIIGLIAEEATQLLEQEHWSAAPLTRSLADPVETSAGAEHRVTHQD